MSEDKLASAADFRNNVREEAGCDFQVSEGSKYSGKVEEFRRAVQTANAQWVTLPKSKIPVLLCRPPIFAALRMGAEGGELQKRVTDSTPDLLRQEDVTAFTEWVCATLTKLFIEPRFSSSPGLDEIGLGELLIEDVQFIFRWLRGEVVSDADGAPEDLATFRGGQGPAALPLASGEAQPVQTK